ncbi:MAG: hypothetical protein ABI672_07580 [Vicinamibacteria bacterium]
MKTNLKSWLVSMATVACVGAPLAGAQTPAVAPTPVSVLGQVESLDAAARTLKIKPEGAGELTVVLHEKGTVMKVAPGETSLQNAATIAFDGITVGDRVLVRGGAKTDTRVDGALRVVVMAKTDLATRDANDQKAWRERAILGTVTSTNPAGNEFTIRLNSPAAAPGAAEGATPPPPPMLVVDASKATVHRYLDTSAKFADAKPAKIADMAEGDQLRFLGTKSADGTKATADRVVFGSFKTRALSIEKVDLATGELSVKDLESNQKFTLTLVAGGTVRKIPAEMGAMMAMMSGGGAAGGAGRFGGRGPGADAGATGGGNRPAGAQAGGPPSGGGNRPAGAMGGGGRPGGPQSGGRSLTDMVDRMPTITMADLKKDDWVGAVVGKVDANGHAIAFNVLAGIEVFASRANRSGGVDVGMPAGLLDGGLGGQ